VEVEITWTTEMVMDNNMGHKQHPTPVATNIGSKLILGPQPGSITQPGSIDWFEC